MSLLVKELAGSIVLDTIHSDRPPNTKAESIPDDAASSKFEVNASTVLYIAVEIASPNE